MVPRGRHAAPTSGKGGTTEKHVSKKMVPVSLKSDLVLDTRDPPGYLSDNLIVPKSYCGHKVPRGVVTYDINSGTIRYTLMVSGSIDLWIRHGYAHCVSKPVF